MDSITSKNRVPKLRFPGFKGEWEEVEFGKLIEESRESSKKEDEDILLTSAIDGVFLNSEKFSHQRGQTTIGYRKIKKGMLILSAQNLHLGNANVNLRFDSGLVSPAYKVYTITGCLPEFMAQWIKKDTTKSFFLNATTQGASQCRKNVVWEQLYKQTILIPPSKQEQERISACLSELDAIILAQGLKVETLKAQKKGLMQQLFPQSGETTPRLRFPGFTGEWEEKKLVDLARKMNRRNRQLEVSRVLTNSANDGVVDQSEYFDRDIAVKGNTDNYHIVELNDFVYNPRISTAAPVGPISINRIGKGIMSPLYTVFKFHKGYVPFFEYYFQTTIWHPYLKSIANFGARFDRMNITSEGFFDMPIYLPSTQAEQQKIASCLSSLDDTIQSETDKLEALKAHKKGLMQQLFPQHSK